MHLVSAVPSSPKMVLIRMHKCRCMQAEYFLWKATDHLSHPPRLLAASVWSLPDEKPDVAGHPATNNGKSNTPDAGQSALFGRRQDDARENTLARSKRGLDEVTGAHGAPGWNTPLVEGSLLGEAVAEGARQRHRRQQRRPSFWVRLFMIV